MTYTATKLSGPNLLGNKRVFEYEINVTSYTTGGEALVSSDFALGRIDTISLLDVVTDQGFLVRKNSANEKIKALKLGATGLTFAGTDGTTVFPYVPGGGDIKGSTSVDGTEGNADQASGPVNATLWAAEQTFTAITEGGLMTIAAQPGVTRNSVITIHNTTGGALDLFQGTTTFTIAGKFRGANQSEAVTLTSTAGNKSVAAAKFRFVAGLKPFDSITSITVTNIGAGGLSVSVGPGSLLGLPVAPVTSSDADFIKVSKNAVNYAVTGKVSYGNQTIDVGTLADGDDIGMIYTVDSQGATSGTINGSAVVTTEAASASNVGKFRVMLYGIG